MLPMLVEHYALAATQIVRMFIGPETYLTLFRRPPSAALHISVRYPVQKNQLTGCERLQRIFSATDSGRKRNHFVIITVFGWVQQNRFFQLCNGACITFRNLPQRLGNGSSPHKILQLNWMPSILMKKVAGTFVPLFQRRSKFSPSSTSSYYSLTF